MSICVRWISDIPPEQQWLPSDPRLTNVTLQLANSDADLQADLTLNTHLFIGNTPLSRARETGWDVATRAEIADCERRFLRQSGKPQDGFVSRWLNRPISRAVTRLLLKSPLTPSAWTLLIFPLPIVASLLFLRGNYWPVLVGMLLFQLYSILDGCDGEIARAKFLESESGRRLDTACDVIGNLLLTSGLGFGLAHLRRFYIWEGCAAAIAIALNEWLLARNAPSETIPGSAAIYPRHRAMIEGSGLLLFGGKFVSSVVQLTKRDVSIVAFVFLAAIGQPAWILHVLLGVTAVSLLLGWKARAR